MGKQESSIMPVSVGSWNEETVTQEMMNFWSSNPNRWCSTPSSCDSGSLPQIFASNDGDDDELINKFQCQKPGYRCRSENDAVLGTSNVSITSPLFHLHKGLNVQTHFSSPLNLQLNQMPGYRFRPTDEELVLYYLFPKVYHNVNPRLTSYSVDHIREVDLYRYEPSELANGGDKGHENEWFFFVERRIEASNRRRPSRRTKCGFWKATGTDKIVKLANPPVVKKSNDSQPNLEAPRGLRKTLVYYQGKAPKGCRTPWIMHEFRLANENNSNCAYQNSTETTITLCKIYKKRASAAS
ncbi:hypothetical protein KP509_10G015300 [Ceratopteris richardii]|uniref:NAC domain-containing protein n=1 Tax=Ceratopteris richardii TaxID=49495 RepID=A0A8T2TV49_CERRI|nr:hypothetical protein KP509_10G015300 [Ceratopteris richardii]